jgi:hypothetical protein
MGVGGGMSMRILAMSLALTLGLVAQPMAAAETPGAVVVAPDARRLELAHRYILAIHMDRVFDATMRSMLPGMMAHMPNSNNLTDKEKQALVDVTTEVSSEMLQKLVKKMEPIMAELFTEKELTELVAFYEGPTGQSLMAKSPLLAQRIAPMAAEMMPEMEAEMMVKMCARIDCSATQRAAKPKSS